MYVLRFVGCGCVVGKRFCGFMNMLLFFRFILYVCYNKEIFWVVKKILLEIMCDIVREIYDIKLGLDEGIVRCGVFVDGIW